MNEERWILATLKRRLLMQGRGYEKNNGYYPSSVTDMLKLIADIEAEAVLGAMTEEELEEVQ